MQTGKMQGNQQDQHNRRRANRVLQQCVLRPDVGGFYLCEHAVYLSYPVCSQMFSLQERRVKNKIRTKLEFFKNIYPTVMRRMA